MNAPAPVEFDLNTLVMEETEVPPTPVKPAEPNIFDGKFPTKEGKWLTFDLPGEKDSDLVKKVTSQARKAADSLTDGEGNPTPMTARVKVEEHRQKVGRGEKVTSKVTVWTVEKIKRPGAGVKKTAETATA